MQSSASKLISNYDKYVLFQTKALSSFSTKMTLLVKIENKYSYILDENIQLVAMEDVICLSSYKNHSAILQKVSSAYV